MTTTQYDAEVKRITDAGGQWPPKTDDTPITRWPGDGAVRASAVSGLWGGVLVELGGTRWSVSASDASSIVRGAAISLTVSASE